MTMAMCGYAMLFEKIIWHDGWWQMFCPGAFDSVLRAGSEIKFLLNHEAEKYVGSTRDILELYADNVGLAFRARLKETDDRESALFTALWMAKNGHQDMSISFLECLSKREIRKIDGKNIVCWIECPVTEISLLYGSSGGAVKQTHAVYQDVDYSISLREHCSSGKIRYDGAAVNFTRALQNLMSKS